MPNLVELQKADQKLIRGNLGLKNSCDAGLPIRVFRKTDEASTYVRNSSMIVYDGLYSVTKAWTEKGASGLSAPCTSCIVFHTCIYLGFLIWRFKLERQPSQPKQRLPPVAFIGVKGRRTKRMRPLGGVDGCEPKRLKHEQPGSKVKDAARCADVDRLEAALAIDPDQWSSDELGELLCLTVSADVDLEGSPSQQACVQCIELLSRRDANLDLIMSEHGMCALALSAFNGYSLAVNTLLRLGADPNARTVTGHDQLDSPGNETPLMLAIQVRCDPRWTVECYCLQWGWDEPLTSPAQALIACDKIDLNAQDNRVMIHKYWISCLGSSLVSRGGRHCTLPHSLGKLH